MEDPDVDVLIETCNLIERNKTVCEISTKFNRKSATDIDGEILNIWKQRVEENPTLFNGTKFRLAAAKFVENELVLSLGVTCYRDFIGTNWSPDAKSIMKRGKELYDDSQAFLSDPLGVGSFLITSDEQVVFLRRSGHVAEAPGLWDIPGGHPEPEEITGKMILEDIDLKSMDPVRVRDEIYDSIIREIVDEVNIDKKYLDDPKFLGIARNTTAAGRPSAEFLIRCSLTSMQVRELYSQGQQLEADESTEIKFYSPDFLCQVNASNPLWQTMSPSVKGCITLYRCFKHFSKE